MGSRVRAWRVVWVGLLIGLLLNLTGWLGNNLLLAGWWREVGDSLAESAWRGSGWRQGLSLVPDFVYGLAIVWLAAALRPRYPTPAASALRAGVFVSLVGGVMTYFAVANTGWIPWSLALASFGLVVATKVPLALLAGRMLG